MDYPAAPAPPPVRPGRVPPQDVPATVVLTGVAALTVVVPGLAGLALSVWGVLALVTLLTEPVQLLDPPAESVLLVVGGLSAGIVPVLLVVGALRLLAGRGRMLLVWSGLPVTALLGWDVVEWWRGDQSGWLFLLIGPGLSPLLALTAPVARWVAPRPPVAQDYAGRGAGP